MFMRMVGADDKYCSGDGAKWWKGGCCEHSGVSSTVLPGNCCGEVSRASAPATADAHGHGRAGGCCGS
jgi:hypothetical protein